MNDQLPVIHSGFSFADMQRLADSIAKSRLFGIQTPEQALTLMAISQAEGRHPALAARDYDIIQGRPAKKAEAMQRDFMAAGGKIEWHKLTDSEAEATFSHPLGGTVRVDWDMDRARTAGLGGKEMWKKYPRQMLKARIVSEGVRTVFPAATSGMYVPEEVRDFREPIDVTPPREVERQVDQWRDERAGTAVAPQFEDVGLDIDKLLAQGNAICRDPALLELWWKTHLNAEQRGVLGAKGRGVGPYLPGWKEGQQQEKQVPAASPPEPPAVEQKTVGGQSLPQADPMPQDDIFGLPISEDEEACANILKEIKACSLLSGVDQVKAHWKHRMEKLPEPLWTQLMELIGQHETALQQRTAL